ncbi:hypothetical protein BDP55DRAFT_679933 [Colletotrichum godetiae]|uniref:Uncharacterized protein n=1 Tax=Colletotrichum godetiae TaxID=1209918 RepID=A0AAJ0EN47_9PEZI|nr:uncharacterized protein BDP55DRAFT_679933 [Colletotrichum godetiae]KAK1659400.1 hypothetical protein BDP55DRAFT_679933 [Colletotrichum godetiae]
MSRSLVVDGVLGLGMLCPLLGLGSEFTWLIISHASQSNFFPVERGAFAGQGSVIHRSYRACRLRSLYCETPRRAELRSSRSFIRRPELSCLFQNGGPNSPLTLQ